MKGSDNPFLSIEGMSLASMTCIFNINDWHKVKLLFPNGINFEKGGYPKSFISNIK